MRNLSTITTLSWEEFVIGVWDLDYANWVLSFFSAHDRSTKLWLRNFPTSTSCEAKIICDLHHHNSNKSKRNNHHKSLKPPQLSDYLFMAERMFSCACAEAPWLQPASTSSSPFPNCNRVTKHGIFIKLKNLCYGLRNLHSHQLQRSSDLFVYTYYVPHHHKILSKQEIWLKKGAEFAWMPWVCVSWIALGYSIVM